MKRDSIIYAAGLFDGEGCVEVYEHGQTRGQGRRVKMDLTMGNTDFRLVKFMHDLFGGTIISKKPKKSHWSPSWVWRVSGEEAERCAILLANHCIAKADQLQLFIILRETTQTGSGRTKFDEATGRYRSDLVEMIAESKRLPG